MVKKYPFRIMHGVAKKCLLCAKHPTLTFKIVDFKSVLEMLLLVYLGGIQTEDTTLCKCY